MADRLQKRLAADGYFLEYDDDRSGSFEPLRFVPPGKIVVLGLVTTKTPALESVDDLKRRVEQAARYVDADRLCLSVPTVKWHLRNLFGKLVALS